MVSPVAADRIVVVEMLKYVELLLGHNFLSLEFWLRRFAFDIGRVRKRKGGMGGLGAEGGSDGVS